MPDDARRPWDLHPALTAGRLGVLARLLAAARRDALARAAWALGDDAWSVGCRAYAFARNRIARVAGGGLHPWLRVLDDSHHFVFLIEGVPVRFYRGDAEEPTRRTLQQQETEARQLALALGDADAAGGLMFRLAVETGEDGAATRVVFLALRGEEGRVECFWPVPSLADEPATAPTGGRGGRERRNDAPAMQLPLPSAPRSR